MQAAAIIVGAVVLFIDLMTHRFQRATLAIANLRTAGKGIREEISKLQMAMTPDWIGHLKLLEYLLALIAAVLLYLTFSWWGAICFGAVYLLGLFAGLGGLVIPIMPHSRNLADIEKHLENSRLSNAPGQRLPIGATTDLSESLHLSYLAGELREEFAARKKSVERIAAGYVEG